LNPGHGTIVGVFYPTRQQARFSPLNMPFIVNLFRNSFRDEAVNYRPYASPSFEVYQASKIIAISPIIIIIIIIIG